jgi:guanylate kinase
MSQQVECLVVAGPSGAGKSTLINGALAVNDRWTFSISATTRPLRPGEQDGREYHFLSREEFEARILRSEFLEYAEVYGNLYGTLASEFDRAAGIGRNLLVEVDTVGCLSIKAMRPEVPLLAVLPPSVGELKRRLRDRGTEDEASLERRFASIVAEVQRMKAFDFVIVNDELEVAQQEFLNLLALVEARGHRPRQRVEEILRTTGEEQ